MYRGSAVAERAHCFSASRATCRTCASRRHLCALHFVVRVDVNLIERALGPDEVRRIVQEQEASRRAARGNAGWRGAPELWRRGDLRHVERVPDRVSQPGRPARRPLLSEQRFARGARLRPERRSRRDVLRDGRLRQQRARVPAWKNEMAEQSWLYWLTYDGTSSADAVTPPTLLVHADGRQSLRRAVHRRSPHGDERSRRALRSGPRARARVCTRPGLRRALDFIEARHASELNASAKHFSWPPLSGSRLPKRSDTQAAAARTTSESEEHASFGARLKHLDHEKASTRVAMLVVRKFLFEPARNLFRRPVLSEPHCDKPLKPTSLGQLADLRRLARDHACMSAAAARYRSMPPFR